MGTHLGAVGVVWLMIWIFGCCGFIGYYGFRWCGDRRITIFPEGRDFTPRPERLPEGEAQGQSQGPRGAKSPPEGNLEGRGGCIFQCIPPLVSVRTFFHHYQGSIDFLV